MKKTLVAGFSLMVALSVVGCVTLGSASGPRVAVRPSTLLVGPSGHLDTGGFRLRVWVHPGDEAIAASVFQAHGWHIEASVGGENVIVTCANKLVESPIVLRVEIIGRCAANSSGQ